MKITISRLGSHRCCVFILTFFSYALFHANRKAFSNVKTSTLKVWTPNHTNESIPRIKPDSIWNSHTMFSHSEDAEHFQGILDTSFLLAYSFGLFLTGYIGDRFNMRILLTIGMAGTSVLVFIFGCVCEWTSFYNQGFYIFIWVLNGLMQSTGWPIVVACMGNWFGQSSRGILLGLWSSCASVGNILGALMAASVLSYGYEYAFLMTSCVLFGAAIITFFGLVTSPEDVGIDIPKNDDNAKGSGSDNELKEKYTKIFVVSDDKPAVPPVSTIPLHTVYPEPLLSNGFGDDHVNSDEDKKLQNSFGGNVKDAVSDVEFEILSTRPSSMPFWKAILLPGVIPYSLAYAFLKLVNYSFFFWLPFYLSNALHWKENDADLLSIIYDVAGIVGGTLVGFISDRVGKRTVLIVPMLILSIPSLLGYSHSPDNFAVNIFLMFLVGFFIGGAANLISAAVSADLGCQKQLKGDDRALATVTGVIDGTGSLGAAVGQIAVPYLQTGFDWHAVFYLFMVCMFLTALCLLPLFVKEICSMGCCAGTRVPRRYSVRSNNLENKSD